MAKKDPVIIKNFSGGWNTEFETDFLDISMSPDLANVNFNASGSIKKDTGYSELGSESDTEVNYDLESFPDRNGVNWLVKSQGEKLKIYDDDTSLFFTIKDSLTAGTRRGYEYFDGSIYVITPDSSEKHLQLDLWRITRTGSSLTGGETTVTVDSTASFETTGSFWLNNVEVTYTGKTATTFTGCTNVPATDTNYLVVASPTELTSASSTVKGNISAIYAGRLWIASGEDSTVYASKLLDFTDFTVTGSGVGDAIQLTVESTANAMKVFYDDQNDLRLMLFNQDNKIYSVDVDDNATLSSTIASKVIFKENVTAQNQFSAIVGYNDLYHVDLNNQIRTLGQTYSSQGVNKVYSDNISQNHQTLFKDSYDFSNSRAVIFNDEYWCVCKEGTGSLNNRVVIFDNITKAWKKRTNINANDIAVYNNEIVYSDASTNKIFKRDNSLSDNGSSIYFKYSTPDLDTEKLRFERLRRVRISGFISAGCEATVTVKSDFNTRTLGTFTIDGSNKDIVGVSSDKKGTFGVVSFGDEIMGGEADATNYRFFIADLELKNLPDLENFRIIIENNQANVYLKITAIKPFTMPQTEDYFPIKYILKTN